MTRKPAEPGRGEELRALEEIVRKLESDETDLDQALKLFEEGVARLRRARARLAEAETAVQAVLVEADGTLRTHDAGL
ncbi:MAG TPA: exodeoxyribonuclease VII small subunit [Gemmatimonadales bacterium]|nr:exodeoxyribonuclease VII small subunit [Gemmatimonadales bacterium]